MGVVAEEICGICTAAHFSVCFQKLADAFKEIAELRAAEFIYFIFICGGLGVLIIHYY